MANLRSLKEEDWHWIPAGGARTIAAIVGHVGECKYVYENHAFGDGSVRWDQPRNMPPINTSDAPPTIVDWLRGGHRRLMRSAASLVDDSELLALRPAELGREL